MGQTDRPAQRRVTSLSAILLAAGFAAAGILAMWLTSDSHISPHHRLSDLLSQVGGLLLATGLLTIGWDLFGRRAFASELFAMAHLSSDIVRSGLWRVTNQYLEEVEWAELFRDVKKLDIVVAYGSTWRNTHGERLRAVAADKEARLRIFLPDPEDADTVRVLAKRFSMTEDVLRGKITEAIREFKDLKQANGATVEVKVRAGDAVFSCYRFDSRAVFTMYSHSARRTSVPTFVVGNGDLFSFVYSELEAIEAQSTPAP